MGRAEICLSGARQQKLHTASFDNVDWDLILKMSNTPRGAGLDKSLDKKLLSKASIDFDPLAATAKPGGAPEDLTPRARQLLSSAMRDRK